MEWTKKHLEQIGDRLQIHDLKTLPNLSSETVINYINNLKSSTNCKRVIVIVDYLQVWPIPENKRFSSDLEADKWRIGEIKKIRDAINEFNEDPVIIISEARKPSQGDQVWGGSMADVMGSARGMYSPDVILLLSALN